MVGSIYKDAEGREFEINYVDHNMNGSWVHYTQVGTDKQFSCLIGAFIERFIKVENSR